MVTKFDKVLVFMYIVLGKGGRYANTAEPATSIEYNALAGRT
jgi:hypothetical protein